MGRRIGDKAALDALDETIEGLARVLDSWDQNTYGILPQPIREYRKHAYENPELLGLRQTGNGGELGIDQEQTDRVTASRDRGVV